MPQDRIGIDVSDGKYTIALITFDKRPVNLTPYLKVVSQNNHNDIGQTDESGYLEAKLSKERYNQPNLLVFLNTAHKRRIVGYIEILRQSEKDLEEIYQFSKPNGYYVLSRTSLKLPRETEKFKNYHLSVADKINLPNLDKYYPNSTEYPPTIRESVALIKFIWDKPLKLGPTNNREPEKLDALTKLELLKKGQWAAQCADIREIFAEQAIASPKILDIRKVDLYQYYPPYPDLITNSHAATEIYSPKLKKWIFVDPYFASIFKLNGELLNAEELKNLSYQERAELEVINFVERRRIRNTWPNLKQQAYFLYLGTIFYSPVYH